MEIALPNEGVRAVVTLLEDEAPKTCKAVWNALPLEGDLHHGMLSGNESFLVMKGKQMFEVEPENQVYHNIPGDVGYYWAWWKAKGFRGYAEPFAEIIIIYGRVAEVRDSTLQKVPYNLFATVTENLKEYAKACSEMRAVGYKKVIIRKYE